ncbi:MAG TPA: molybdopterin dinucleotide binding domain-containing protein, partial [Solirubrobacteraceae bacterium]|nr:molybdopterin dinucleotide binding domain-containing protein [Solirubrobacteraceae bacterium]
DAERLGLADGEHALVRSAAGSLEAPVETTEDIMPGVISIPHGWGHGAEGVRMSVASAHAGVNSNVLADESVVEPLSGNAVLNGIPVEVSALRKQRAVPAAPRQSLDGLEHRAAAVAADDVRGV